MRSPTSIETTANITVLRLDFIQTGPGTHSAPYPMGTTGSFPGGEASGA